MATFFILLGFACYLFGIIDFLGMFFQYDLTGTSYSPVIAGIIGTILIRISNWIDANSNPLTQGVKLKKKYLRLMKNKKYLTI